MLNENRNGWFWAFSIAVLLCSCSRPARVVGAARVSKLAELVPILAPLQRPLPAAGPSDWLASHEEPGQTFREYVACEPVTALGTRRVLYLRRIGEFTPKEEEVLTLTIEFLGLYYGLEVRLLDSIPVDETWPKKARRTHPSWGDDQLLSTYILRSVLRPSVPDDGAVLLGLTSYDLWPGRSWNFVFGQASLKDRVGVWSLHRNGDPEGSEDDFRTFLRRTIKTASHEVGHAFSMLHCTAYDCNLCGSNTREESDRHPLWLCAECLPKACLATGSDPVERYAALLDFSRRHGLLEEADYWGRALKLLREEWKP